MGYRLPFLKQRSIKRQKLSDRFRKFWGHPLSGLYHGLYKLIWIAGLRLGLSGRNCFIAASPMHYACFRRIHAFIPDVRIIADNLETARYFRRNRIKFSWFPGFPRCIIMADYLHMRKSCKRYPASVRIIQINHGLGLAKSHYYVEALTCPPLALYLVSGEAAKIRLKEMGLQQPIAAVGFAKLDPLFDGSLDKGKILHRLGLSPNKPSILYAPTFGELSTFNQVLPHLPELARRYNLLVKLHQHTFRHKFSALQKDILQNITLIEDADCTEYLFAADLLISDVSSLVFEYALLNRPIVLIQPPEELWHPKVTNPEWWNVGHMLKDSSQLIKTVECLLKDGDQKDDIRRRLFEFAGIPTDGKTAERSAKAIQEVTQEG